MNLGTGLFDMLVAPDPGSGLRHFLGTTGPFRQSSLENIRGDVEIDAAGESDSVCAGLVE